MDALKNSANELNNSFFFLENTTAQIIAKWSARAVVACLAGYYSLGYAYHSGLMAKIDQYAIQFFLHFFGYAGLGAFMPTFQWYSAWTVRITSGILAAAVWDISIKIAYYISTKISNVMNRISPAPQINPPVLA